MKCCKNHPNPFFDSTSICYQLPKTSKVGMDIYNSEGKMVYRLVTHTQTAGSKSIDWDGKNQKGEKVPSGIYYYIIKVDDSYELSNEMEILSEAQRTVELISNHKIVISSPSR